MYPGTAWDIHSQSHFTDQVRFYCALVTNRNDRVMERMEHSAWSLPSSSCNSREIWFELSNVAFCGKASIQRKHKGVFSQFICVVVNISWGKIQLTELLYNLVHSYIIITSSVHNHFSWGWGQRFLISLSAQCAPSFKTAHNSLSFICYTSIQEKKDKKLFGEIKVAEFRANRNH